MKSIRILQPAEQEMLDAAYYYELQAAGLGSEFLDKIDSAIADISSNPDAWQVVHGRIHRRLVVRFPYALLYRIDINEIAILAIMHLHRRPLYWMNRLDLL